MKLAEGLVLRADIVKRIQQLRERLRLSAIVQDGEEPPENPQELFTELKRLLDQMTVLVQRINRTNLQSTLSDGRSLTTALAERDTLSLYHNVLMSTIEAASPRMERLGRAEIKKVPTVKIADLRRLADDAARQRRELDTMIQSVNWSTDLLE